MKDLIGRKVLMKPRIAKWHLEHPEVYSPKDENYESETLLQLVACLGEPVYGRVLWQGTDCWQVKFRVGSITASYYIDCKDFILV